MIAMKMYLKQENNYMFLTTSKVKFLYIKGFMGPFMCFIHTHEHFFKNVRKKDEQQWMIDCSYTKLQRLCHLLRCLERQPYDTILIRLMYAKTQLVFQVYQWSTYWTTLWQKRWSLSYMHQEAFITQIEINEKNLRTEVAMVPWNVVIIAKKAS